MFSTDSIIPRIAMQNKCSFFFFGAIHLPPAEEGEFLLYYVKNKYSCQNLFVLLLVQYIIQKKKSTDVRSTFVPFLSLQFNFSKLFSLRQRECNAQLFKITLLRSETSLSPQIPLLYSHWHMYIPAK